MTRQDDNICKRIESTEKFVPFSPSATSYGMGWKTLQAVRYRESPASGQFSLPPVSRHGLVLTIRPARKKRRHSGLYFGIEDSIPEVRPRKLLGKQLAGVNAFAANPGPPAADRHFVQFSRGREKCGLASPSPLAAFFRESL